MNPWLVLLIIIIFIFWAPFLVPFGLTINEELFVFLSFILFVELLGRTLAAVIASLADARRAVAVQALTASAHRELKALIALRQILVRITSLASFRSVLVSNFAIEIFHISQQPNLDQSFLFCQSFYRTYVSVLRLECRLIRNISQLALVTGLSLLKIQLLNLPLLQPVASSLTMVDFVSLTGLGLQPRLASSFNYDL
jgi:hypothetical protein